MLNKADILSRLRKNRRQIEKCGVSQIGLFGSYVQNNQNEDSDIDILIDFYEKDETFDNFMNICEVLENLFKDKKVDVITKNGLSKFIKPYILKEVEYV
jgi:predicted nucleotidyltransferase